MKKILTLLLVLTMVLSLAACTSSSTGTTSSTAPKAGDTQAPATTTDSQPAANLTPDPETGLIPMADTTPITFSIFVRDPNTAPAKDNPVLKKITELTGVTLEWEFVVGDLDQKIGVMLSGGDYPDIIVAGDRGPKFIDAGAYLALDDKLPNYPNLNAHYSPFLKKLSAADGHFYTLELYDVTSRPSQPFQNWGSGFFIQKDVIKEAGYKVPKTVDEYFEMIDSYKEKYPTIDGVKTIGFEVLSDGWRNFCLLNPAQFLMGAGNDGGVYVDLNKMEASWYQDSETAKSYYAKLNQEFLKGTIEAETFTQTYDQYIARLSSGAVLGMFDQRWNFNQAPELLYNDGKYERTYISVPLANPGVQDAYMDATSPTGNNGVGISVDCKDPDRVLAFYDWLLQEDVQKYLAWGTSADYKVAEDGVGLIQTAERRAIVKDVAKQRDLTGHYLWNYSPKLQGLFSDGSPCSTNDSTYDYLDQQLDYDKEFFKALDIQVPAQLLSPPVKRPAYYPVWAMAIEDGSPAKFGDEKQKEICAKYYPKLIMAPSGTYDAVWDEFVKEFRGANIQPFLDEVNRQIKLTLE